MRCAPPAWMRLAVAVFTLIAVASPTASAVDDEEVSPFDAKPTTIYFVTGPLTPVGFFGFEAERNVLSFWSLSAGAGFGYSGPQIAAMTHLLLGGKWSKLAIGAGLSHGRYVWDGIAGDELIAQKSGTVTWANVEIGGERRWQLGLSFRYFVGYGHVIAGDVACESATSADCLAFGQNDGYDTLYAGLGIGFAF